MGHFLSWPSGCSERDRSQLTEGWELVNLKQVTVCMSIYDAKNTVPKPQRPSDVVKCSLMKPEVLSHIIQTYTHKTGYLLTGQTSKKVSGSLGSKPQTNWVLTHTFNITHLWSLVPGWIGGAIIESWLASESMTQNQEGNQEHFHTVCMRELVGTWDRSEGLSGPAQWPGSEVG